MNKVINAMRIILVLPSFFLRVLALVVLLSLGLATPVQAQSRYQLQMTVDLNGRPYSVPMTLIGVGDRQELPTQPAGGLRVYVRAIPLSGVSGQALLDMQIYEPRAQGQTQIASLTMTAYLGSQNSAEVETTGGKGKLVISAYVQDAAKATTPAAPIGQSLPSPQLAAPSSNRPRVPSGREPAYDPDHVPGPDNSAPMRTPQTDPVPPPQTPSKKYYDAVVKPKPIPPGN